MVPNDQTPVVKRLLADEVADFSRLLQIFKSVFEHEHELPEEGYLRNLLSNPGFMAFVVRVNNRVVGGLTLYVLNGYYITAPLAYVYDVGVQPSFQGKGLGKKLIREVCEYCKQQGFATAFVQAESADEDALEFYRKTGYTQMLEATQFSYDFL